LGAIPQTWSLARLQRYADFQSGGGFPEAHQGDLSQEFPFLKVDDLGKNAGHEIKSWQNTVSKSTASQLGVKILPKGTLVMAKIGAALLLGRVRQLVVPSCIDNNMIGIAPRKKLSGGYFSYFLSILDFAYFVNPGTVPSTSGSAIGGNQIPIPPKAEQDLISKYLDKETSRIDALISKKEQLIEKLTERRQALITQAVTEGLDPNVPMKDSGVEWLGEVPQGWDVKPLWSISKAFAGGTPESSNSEYWDDAEGIPWIVIGDMSDVTLVLSTSKAVSMLGRTIKRLPLGEPGNVLFAMYASVGATAILGIAATWNQAILGLKIDPLHAEEKYVFFLLKGISDVWNLLSNSNTQANLNQHSVMHLRIPLPSKSEQAEITAYLDQETSQIDTLVEKTRRAIELLKERRQALITQVVTGKIDVRGFAGGNS